MGGVVVMIGVGVMMVVLVVNCNCIVAEAIHHPPGPETLTSLIVAQYLKRSQRDQWVGVDWGWGWEGDNWMGNQIGLRDQNDDFGENHHLFSNFHHHPPRHAKSYQNFYSPVPPVPHHAMNDLSVRYYLLCYDENELTRWFVVGMGIGG